jgi:DNA-binding MarR family transcriptional regulator
MLKSYKEVANAFENAHLFRCVYSRERLQGKGIYDKQYPILNFIYNNSGCTQIEIAKALFISPASVAISTRRLMKGGLITKRIHENSLRTNRVFLTEKGESVVKECRVCMQETDNQMFKDFSDDEIETLKGYLKRMVSNLAGEEDGNLNALSRAAFKNRMRSEERG